MLKFHVPSGNSIYIRADSIIRISRFNDLTELALSNGSVISIVEFPEEVLKLIPK